jgi:hypothetical protein
MKNKTGDISLPTWTVVGLLAGLGLDVLIVDRSFSTFSFLREGAFWSAMMSTSGALFGFSFTTYSFVISRFDSSALQPFRESGNLGALSECFLSAMKWLGGMLLFCVVGMFARLETMLLLLVPLSCIVLTRLILIVHVLRLVGERVVASLPPAAPKGREVRRDKPSVTPVEAPEDVAVLAGGKTG